MRNKKFKYNPDTLCYEEIRLTFKQRAAQFFKGFSLTSVLALGLLWASTYFLETPKLNRLREEQRFYLFSLKLLNSKIDDYSNKLGYVEYNDDYVYRSYFDLGALPVNQRNPAIGGVNKYENLDGYKFSEEIITLSKKTDLLSRKIVVQSRSFDEISKMVINKEKRLAARPAIQPIALKDLVRFGSPFGMRFHPLLHVVRMHEGIDLTAPLGTNIYASANGRVVQAEYSLGGYGKMVKVDHGYGYQTIYAHMSKILVKPGDQVERGQVIGLVGSTGLSAAPHLHYEVHVNGKPVNPINYYSEDLDPDEYDKMIDLLANSNPQFDIH